MIDEIFDEFEKFEDKHSYRWALKEFEMLEWHLEKSFLVLIFYFL